MTKEELEKEAREKYHNHKIEDFQGFYLRNYYCLGYLESAEPREKRIAELEKENAELKNNNNVYCEGNGETLVVNVSFDSFTRINANHKMYYSHNNELEKENAELKEKYVKNLCDCDICDTYCNSQLIKAKEIIRKFSEFANNEVEYDFEHPQEHTDLWNELCEEAEQFLKEVSE